MTRLAFLATGQTGSNPRQHELFDLALVERIPGQVDHVSNWRLRPQRMPDADPAELSRIGYFDRLQYGHDAVHIDPDLGTTTPVELRQLAADLSGRLFDTVLVCLFPGTELPFLGAFMERQGALPAWRRSVDLTSVAAGALQGHRHGWYSAARLLGRPISTPPADLAPLDVLPWDPYRLARALGLTVEATDTTDAYTRACLARALWDAITAQPPPPVDEAPAEPPAEQPRRQVDTPPAELDDLDDLDGLVDDERPAAPVRPPGPDDTVTTAFSLPNQT